MNKRYAYLIIANRNPKQLQKLITMLDDSRNDIYLMIDKKSKNYPHNFHVNYSGLNYVKPINIYWGGYSQIQAELDLFNAAAPEHYAYYHLLSGLDLPLVNQDKIHNFFDNHPNKEFIKYFSINATALFYLNSRLKPHIFRRHLLSRNVMIRIIRFIYWEILRFVPQNLISQRNISFGSNWVSIDDSLIQYILQNENWIKNHFYKGVLVDELFIPILINLRKEFNSKLYRSKTIDDNLRYIKFTGGNAHPKILTVKNLGILSNAVEKGYLFARKFDEVVDSNIISKIFLNVMKSS